MKTKGFRLFGCLLLICVIGLAVSIGTSLGNGKTPLSDEALCSVYGGCGPCAIRNYDGCRAADTSCTDKPDTEQGCIGHHRTTCKQTQKDCLEQTAELCDDSMTKACFYEQYTSYTCGLDLGECVNLDPGTHSCFGSKDWCLGEFPGDD